MTVMGQFAYKGCQFNYCGRSGGASGSDSCLEVGVNKYLEDSNRNLSASSFMEIYLPWKDFNGRDSNATGYYTLSEMSNKYDARSIARAIHPKWVLDDKVEQGEIIAPRNWMPMRQGAKYLHTRNVYQLLGQDLNTPSRFVLCWAEPKCADRRTEEVKGGTGTAVKLGIDNGVEIINLYHQDNLDRVLKWINK